MSRPSAYLAQPSRATLLEPGYVARLAQVHAETVYRWIHRGRITAVNLGTDDRPVYRLDRFEVAAFFRARGATESTLRRLLV